MQRYLKGWEGFAAIRRSPIAAVLLIIGKGLLPLPLLVSDLIMPALFLKSRSPLCISTPPDLAARPLPFQHHGSGETSPSRGISAHVNRDALPAMPS